MILEIPNVIMDMLRHTRLFDILLSTLVGAAEVSGWEVYVGKHYSVGIAHGSSLCLQELWRAVYVSTPSLECVFASPNLTCLAVVTRLLLGASEGCVTNGIMIILPMFYTRREIGQRLGWTIQCNGLGIIVSSFLAFGAAHLQSGANVARWQLLMLICSALALAVGVWFLLLFPDSPIRARFLTEDEKIKVVQRIRANQTGTETKLWKREQLIEAVKDVKTWLFFLFATIS